MIENLQDKLYQLENKQTKDAKLHANIRWEFKAKNASKLFSKYLKGRICKIKKISLDEVMKSIDSQINDKYTSIYGLMAEYYLQFSNELASVLMIPRESLAPWVLLLEHESYLSYIKKGDGKDISNYRSIYYNSSESTSKQLDIIIGEN